MNILGNNRYITGTHIGEWCRDKMDRYAPCPREGGAYLFDPAVPAKRISSPFQQFTVKDNGVL